MNLSCDEAKGKMEKEKEMEMEEMELKKENARKHVIEAMMSIKYGVKNYVDGRYYKKVVKYGLDDLRLIIENLENDNKYVSKMGSGKVIWNGDGHHRASVEDLLMWHFTNNMIRDHIEYLVSNGKAIKAKEIAKALNVTPQKVSKVIWMMKRDTSDRWIWQKKDHHGRSIYIVHTRT